jgi:IclR family acetate operon transcriptional repressor
VAYSSVSPTDDRYRVQSLGRALDLVELIANRGKDGARLTDLARELGMSKAAVYALLQTLLARGFLSDFAEGANRRYRLGMSLARLGDLAVANIALADVAMPELRKLTADLGMTSRLAILDDGYAVVVGRVDAPGAIRFDSALGRSALRSARRCWRRCRRTRRNGSWSAPRCRSGRRAPSPPSPG